MTSRNREGRDGVSEGRRGGDREALTISLPYGHLGVKESRFSATSVAEQSGARTRLARMSFAKEENLGVIMGTK